MVWSPSDQGNRVNTRFRQVRQLMAAIVPLGRYLGNGEFQGNTTPEQLRPGNPVKSSHSRCIRTHLFRLCREHRRRDWIRV